MKARNLASPQPVVRVDAPARDAAAVLARHEVRAVLVVDEHDEFIGVVSDSELLRGLLPPYVDQAGILAHVLEEGAAEVLYRRLEGRSVADLMPDDRDVIPLVGGDDTLVEVASVMVRGRTSAVGVTDEGRLIGGITIDDLLSHLLSRR
jgi:CBS domain-containing protein